MLKQTQLKPERNPSKLDKNTQKEKYQSIKNFFEKIDEETNPKTQAQTPNEQIPPNNEPPPHPQIPPKTTSGYIGWTETHTNKKPRKPKPTQKKQTRQETPLEANDTLTKNETKTKTKPEDKKPKKKKTEKPLDIKSFLAPKKLELE